MATDAGSAVPVDSDKKERQRLADETRFALCDRLESEGAPDLSKPLRGCGQKLPLTCTHCGEIHETVTRCMCRYCPSCQPLVALERVNKWRHAIQGLQWPLFVTLTLPNSEDPEQLRYLKKCWAKFRRRKLIATRVAGGVATFEVTNIGNGWHPHLHAVMDCRWLAIHTPEPQHWQPKEHKDELCRRAAEELSGLWADQINSPSASVKVRRVYGTEVVREALKYGVKGSDLIASPDPIAPLLRVLKSTRTLSGWGSLFPMPSPDKEEGPRVGCESCGAVGAYVPTEIAWVMARRS